MMYWILANFILTETSFCGYLTFLGEVNMVLKRGNFVRIAKQFSFSEKFQFLKTSNCVGCYTKELYRILKIATVSENIVLGK